MNDQGFESTSRRTRTQRQLRRRGFVQGVAFTLAFFAVAATSVTFARTRYEDLALFTSVLTHVRSNYVESVDEHDLLTGALNGMLGELDPHSAFLDTDAYEEMQVDTRGEFHGLGIEITKRQGEPIEVVSPIDGTPAARAGIRARDRIVMICPTEKPEEWNEDCRNTKSMSLLEAVQHMRGRKGTEITIHILRGDFEAPRPFTVVRDVVQIDSVEGKLLEPGYGYLRISAFQERTDKELEESLAAIHAEIAKTADDENAAGRLQGLVIDLRDNPGGLLDQAVKVADAWLDEGVIVYTQGREVAQRQDYLATDRTSEPDYPVVVLVNEGSASASEIVAGALQDHGRALVLGAESFGKGSVQTVYPLEGGAALRLTTALYYTPSGRSIQETGIRPDIAVAPTEIPTMRVSPPKRMRERDLEGHFTQEEADPEDAGPSGETPGEEQQGEFVDAPLERALEVLKSWRYFDQLRSPQEVATQN